MSKSIWNSFGGAPVLRGVRLPLNECEVQA